MKVAFVSDDTTTISRHFGRAKTYVVFTARQGMPMASEVLPKINHCSSQLPDHRRHQTGRGMGEAFRQKHQQSIEAIKGCDVVVSRGMGRGIYLTLLEKGIKPIITDFLNIDHAMEAVLDGTITNYPDRLH